MDIHHEANSGLTFAANTDKVLQGIKLAIQQMIEKKKKEDGYIVVSEKGKVVRKRARDL